MILDRIYRKDGQREIAGALLPVFIKNGSHHFLTSLKVWQDGSIDCWEHVSLKGLEHKIASGWVVTALPEGAEVSVHSLGRFKATEVHSFVAEAELLKQVADVIEELNDRPTSADRVREALRKYAEQQTPENKEQLRIAYEAVPAHLRMYLGDQDRKDFPIRVILYGDQEIEDWSHRKASRAAGLPRLLEINIQGYLEEVRPTPKRVLAGKLTTALHQLYRADRDESFFAKESATEIEELFRTGKADEAIDRLNRDIATLDERAAKRPKLKLRVSGAADSLGEFLMGAGQESAGEALLWTALRSNPDGLSALRLAELAVKRADRGLAIRLMAELASAGLTELPGKIVAKPLQIDIEGFEQLLVP